MKRFVERLRRSEDGYTLIELIAALSLLSLVLGVIYATISFGTDAYGRVQAQNGLREDADSAMSAVMARLYAFGAERIGQAEAAAGSGIVMQAAADGSGQARSEQVAIRRDAEGKGRLYIGDTPLELGSELATEGEGRSAIELRCPDGGGECSSGLLEIRLRLLREAGGRVYSLDLASKFGF
ncbi:prepilin-type N-terminal cleavage/methylation domain-containing protein [Paenibacillus pasadenensis]|uniref:prepilin-type N-terminal cleavage/methylation domain-containing protein n=1 Tax=Paenibacillus TaxID=44249 RepID=UPI000417FCE2|nr:prepilin-type N-terminal cleavage/methylation domain-containing protein [Paenibacillus pasadenensis]